VTEHKTGTREEWLVARAELLEGEKELTRRSDELARQRRELPVGGGQGRGGDFGGWPRRHDEYDLREERS